MKCCLLSFFFIIGSITLSGQTKMSWEQLADVTFKPEVIDDFGTKYLVPYFGSKIKSLEGERVQLRGYIIPLDGTGGNTYVLSKVPYQMCFFCSGAGPETVVELQLKSGERTRFTMDDQLTFEGALKLNRKDVMHLNYILKEAKQVK